MASRKVAGHTTSATETDPSRRRFMAAAGALGALAATGARASGTRPERRHSTRWADVRDVLLPQIRAAYLDEIGRLAETLRPRFEAGELRGYRNRDDRDGDSPQWEVDRVAAKWFGITDETDETERIASLIVAASPRGFAVQNGSTDSVASFAKEAAAWDVICLARERGWYRVTRDETEDPLISYDVCESCGHRLCCHLDEHDEDGLEPGCHVHDSPGERCSCTVRHSPHARGGVAAPVA